LEFPEKAEMERIIDKPGGDNGSICGKKGYFTWHKKISCIAYTHLFSVVSPLYREWGIPSRFPRINF
jgi:hypothetical protein